MDRYLSRKDRADLDRAITLWHQSIEGTPDSSAALPSRLNRLATGLIERHELIGGSDDLEAAVWYLQRAVELTPPGAAAFPMVLGKLGEALFEQYLARDRREDLDDAIRALSQSNERSVSPRVPSILASCLQYRFGLSGELNDLLTAINVCRRALRSGDVDVTTRGILNLTLG
jgi:hypothetical protein